MVLDGDTAGRSLAQAGAPARELRAVMGKRWQYIEPGSEEIKGDWVLVWRSGSHGVLPWQPTHAEQWAMEAEARKTWTANLRQRRAMLAARQPELPAVQEAVDQCLVGYTP